MFFFCFADGWDSDAYEYAQQQGILIIYTSRPPKLVEIARIPRLIQQNMMYLVDNHDEKTEVVGREPLDGRGLLPTGGGKGGQKGALVSVQPGDGLVLPVDGVAQDCELRIAVVQQPLQRRLVRVYRRRQRLQLPITVVHQEVAELPVALQALQEGDQHLRIII